MQNLIKKISLFLLDRNFIVKNINSCFDVVAKKDSLILLIKIVSDANSIHASTILEMKKIPIIIRLTS